MPAQSDSAPTIQPIGSGDQDRLLSRRTTPPLPNGGYCLFTAGAVNAGKSTLQHALIHRLYRDERIDLIFRSEDGDTSPSPALLNWILRFDRGEFPARTPEGMLQTFFIEFGQPRRPVRLSFVEISGEHFQSILPKNDQLEYEARLPSVLEHILTAGEIKKLFIFVADTTRHDPANTIPKAKDDRDQALYEDMIFSCLLTHMQHLGLRRIRLLFAATKWDATPNRNLDPEGFFGHHFPQTRAALRRFEKSQVQYVRFSVGNVQNVEEKSVDGPLVPQIVQRDFMPIDRVIQWVHTHATDRRLKGYPAIRPTLWEKIKGWAAT